MTRVDAPFVRELLLGLVLDLLAFVLVCRAIRNHRRFRAS